MNWLRRIDVMATLVARTNEYANIFHGSIQWLPLPPVSISHFPPFWSRLTHQDLSRRTLLPLLADGRRSGAAGRAPLPLNKTELWLPVFTFALLQLEYLARGLSQRRNVYLLHIFATAAVLLAFHASQSSRFADSPPFGPASRRRRQHFVASQKLRKY